MRGRPRLLSDDALLDAAAKVLRREGARTTTDAIAHEAGVSTIKPRRREVLKRWMQCTR